MKPKHLFVSSIIILLVGAEFLAAQFFVENRHDEQPHPIDKKYEGKLEFLGTAREMDINISAASKEWMEELEKQSASIESFLREPKRKLFKEAQDLWMRALKADEAFFFSDFKELQFAIGREGVIVAQLEFMNRIRGRALDLIQYVKIFNPDSDNL
jgi:hypothetical protein